MKRRAVLGLLAGGVGAGCLRRLPRATGPRGPPDAPTGQPREPVQVLDIATWDVEEASDGRLRVIGTVQNTGGAQATATVAATVTVEGERTTRSTQVTVPAGGTAPFELVFEVNYDTFAESGSVSIELA